MTTQLKGAWLTLLAGIAWGISGISGQYLMEEGVDVILLTSLRLLVSGLVVVGLVLMKNPQPILSLIKSPRKLLVLTIFAILGLMLNQYAYLSAVHYTNAGTATVLQYLAPVVLVVYVSLKNHSWPRGIEFLALILALAGTFLLATHGHFESLSINPSGFFWGVLSAFTYAVYILLPARLIKEEGSLPVIGLAMLLGGSAFPLLTQAWQYQLPLTGMTLLALLGLIGVGTIFAYAAFLKGASLVGAVEASLLASIEPVAAVFFALTLMGETFYPVDILGIGLIMLAVLLISLKDYLFLRKKT